MHILKKNNFLFFLFIIINYNCNLENIIPTNIYALKSETLNWDQLDIEIQNALKKNKSYNIDSKEFFKVKNTSVIGVIKGRIEFSFKGVIYYFSWNYNKEVIPFIIKNDKLYFLYDEVGGGPMFKTNETMREYRYLCFNLYS